MGLREFLWARHAGLKVCHPRTLGGKTLVGYTHKVFDSNAAFPYLRV